MTTIAGWLRRIAWVWVSACVSCVMLLFISAAFATQGLRDYPSLSRLGWLAVWSSMFVFGGLLFSLLVARAGRVALVLSSAVVAALSWWLIGDRADYFLQSTTYQAIANSSGLAAIIKSILVLGTLVAWWLTCGVAKTGISKTNRGMRCVGIVASLALAVFVTVIVNRYRSYDSVAIVMLPVACLVLAATIFSARSTALKLIFSLVSGAALLVGLHQLANPLIATRGRSLTIAGHPIAALAEVHLLPLHRKNVAITAENEPECAELTRKSERYVKLPKELRRNVIIVTIDALRSDAVEITSAGRAVMPTLRKWSKRGYYVPNAISTYPATLPALGSAFTGLSPTELFLFDALPQTIFDAAANVVDRQIIALPDDKWFRSSAFQEFFAAQISAVRIADDVERARVFSQLLQAAKNNDQSVLAWLHLYAPHEPYEIHEGFKFVRGRRGDYLSDVAYADQAISVVMSTLESGNWLADTLVLIFSDHGEALGENRYYGHHVYLNTWMIDVPLLMLSPQTPPSRSQDMVSIADVAPTIADFLGLQLRSNEIGISLFSPDIHAEDRRVMAEAIPMRGTELLESVHLSTATRQAFDARLDLMHSSIRQYEPKVALVGRDFRYILHRASGAEFLYNRKADPFERKNVFLQEPEALAVYRQHTKALEQAAVSRARCRLQAPTSSTR